MGGRPLMWLVTVNAVTLQHLWLMRSGYISNMFYTIFIYNLKAEISEFAFESSGF